VPDRPEDSPVDAGARGPSRMLANALLVALEVKESTGGWAWILPTGATTGEVLEGYSACGRSHG